jgi:hypothetical protein
MEAIGGFGYIGHIAHPPARRNTVNIAKHMEAVFVVALAAAGSASFFTETLPEAQARPAAIQDSSIATETRMAVVVVKGKRPGTAEPKPPTVLADRSKPGSRI